MPLDGGDAAPPAGKQAIDDLFSAAYEELRRLASLVRKGDAVSRSATSLVNEAWLKLVRSKGIAPQSRLHFKRIVARAMRQVLVEAARRRNAGKRGSALEFVTLDEAVVEHATTSEDVLALDAALQDLARLHPRQAEMIECRFFGGFDTSETAALLGVSEATVLRDWRAAKAWLAQEIRRRNRPGVRS